MATKGSNSWTQCISFIEESLLLPTQNIRLFISTFQLIFLHTFLFIAVAVLGAHPLAAAILSDIEALKTTDTASDNDSVVVDSPQEHAKRLILIYLVYHVSKLTTQLVAVAATASTYSGEHRSFTELLRRNVAKKGARALSFADYSTTASVCGYLLSLLVLLLNIFLGVVFPASIAVSAFDDGCRGPWALRRAWRLMGSRRKVAAVLVLVAGLLPAAMYRVPVFAFSFVYPPDTFALVDAVNGDLWMLSVVLASVLPSAGAQLLSTVTATVFCCQAMEINEGSALPIK
ncbi:hypothetical protein ACP70R_023559 [Stipagrostis hirtigluma subsp. patula]